MSAGPNREQRRAAHAYEVVRAAQDEGGVGWSRYQGLVMGLPVVILRCGLVGAVAWLRRQEGGDRVCRDLARAKIPGIDGKPDALLPTVCALPLPQYMVASREALKVASWLKRAAQAVSAGRGEPRVGGGGHA